MANSGHNELSQFNFTFLSSSKVKQLTHIYIDLSSVIPLSHSQCSYAHHWYTIFFMNWPFLGNKWFTRKSQGWKHRSALYASCKTSIARRNLKYDTIIIERQVVTIFAHSLSFVGAWSGLDIGLVGPVARGASRFENLLAPQKTYWPGGPVDLKTYWPPNKLTDAAPQKTNWSLPQNQTCATKNYLHKPTICT